MMLYKGFRKIFWGFIFVFIEIHIIAIDILPDPVGYFLIYTGMKLVNIHDEFGSGGKFIAFGLVYFTLPTVFLQNTTIEHISGWFIYMSVIGILNLVLAFYILQMMVLIATGRKENHLLRRTETSFKFYMISVMVITFFEPFALNMNLTEGTGYFMFSSLLGFIMNIIFLVLLSKFSKLPDGFEDPSGTIAEDIDRKEPPIGSIQ